MINYKRLTISIDQDTLYYLKRRAKKNKRSVSAEADWILSYFLDVDRRKQKEWKNLPKENQKNEPYDDGTEDLKGLQEKYTYEEALEMFTKTVGKSNAHYLLDLHKEGFKK